MLQPVRLKDPEEDMPAFFTLGPSRMAMKPLRMSGFLLVPAPADVLLAAESEPEVMITYSARHRDRNASRKLGKAPLASVSGLRRSSRLQDKAKSGV
jgi:hypothetical protein